jgi:hypothetical protein
LKEDTADGRWQMKIPNAMKMFMWRAYNDVLSTRGNHIKRKIDIDQVWFRSGDH